MQYRKYKTTRIKDLRYIREEESITYKLGFYKELIEDITDQEVITLYYEKESHNLLVRFKDNSVVLEEAGTDARELTKNIIMCFSDYKNKELARELRKSIQRALKENNFWSCIDVDDEDN